MKPRPLTTRLRAFTAICGVFAACGGEGEEGVVDGGSGSDGGTDMPSGAESADAGLDGASDADDAHATPGMSSLQVTVGGLGSGTVTSSPAGISCTTGACAADFGADTVVTLTATASVGSVFAGWGGACTGTGTCVVTMTEARNVTATFTLMTVTLEITKSGDGAGTVSGNGLDCGGTCVVTLPYGTAVVLTASASIDDETASTFTGWSGAGCSSTGACMITITSDRSFDAGFKLKPNLMFTTSTTYTGNLGGLGGADTKCQQLAVAHNRPGHYRAYLGATATNAPSRVGAATGWTRVDGTPLVQAIGDFGTTALPHPPSLDESGNDLSASAQLRVWTATSANTQYFGQNCNNAGMASDWSTTNANTTTGLLTATDSNVLVGGSIYTCASALRLYCFGIDRAATLP